MSLPPPIEQQGELERARRRGRSLVEIVRCHVEKIEIPNQRFLGERLKRAHNSTPPGGTLAADITWLRENGWLTQKTVKTGNRLKLRKRGTHIIADSWCIQSLLIAASLTDKSRNFSLSEWREQSKRIFLQEPRINATRADKKCAEFLEEFSDCGYVTGASEEFGTAQFVASQWNEDWFYLDVAKDAGIHRPFDQRK